MVSKLAECHGMQSGCPLFGRILGTLPFQEEPRGKAHMIESRVETFTHEENHSSGCRGAYIEEG